MTEERKKAYEETARYIIERAEEYLGELIVKHLGYEYGNGYREGFNHLQDVCRTLAAEVLELRVLMRTPPAIRTELDPTAKAFVQEAEDTWENARKTNR